MAEEADVIPEEEEAEVIFETSHRIILSERRSLTSPQTSQAVVTEEVEAEERATHTRKEIATEALDADSPTRAVVEEEEVT